MTSRERVNAALTRREPDRIPRDFSSTGTTGLSASFVYRLRKHLGLPERPIRIYCPYQMLGEVDVELRDWMRADVVSPWPENNLFGYDNIPSVPFTMPDGTPVLAPEAFNTRYEPNGRLNMYAGGDRSYPPSAVMPARGCLFDTIIRASPVDDGALRRAEKEADSLYQNTDYALKRKNSAAVSCSGEEALTPGARCPLARRSKYGTRFCTG